MLILDKHGLLGSEILPDEMHAEWGEFMDLVKSEISDTLENSLAQLRQIEKDSNLSSVGKIKKQQEIAQFAIKTLKKKHDNRRAFFEQKAEQALAGVPKSIEEAMKDQRPSEFERFFIIQKMEKMDELNLKGILAEAVSQQDSKTIWALKSAPKCCGFDMDLIADAEKAYLQEAYQAAFDKEFQVEQVKNQYRSNTKTGMRMLAKEGHLDGNETFIEIQNF